MKLLFLLFLLVRSNATFWKIPFGKSFKISNREVNKPVITNNNNNGLSQRDMKLVEKINGFYGIIGPDFNATVKNTLYDLFMSDGVLQGVFFDRGNVSFVRHFIRTEKMLYEEENGRMQKEPLLQLLSVELNKLGVLPNMMGLANTALLLVKNKLYATFERDLPYELSIDFENKTINTISKKNINNMEFFSGHSKYRNNTIETIDYYMTKREICYYLMDENFHTLRKIPIKTKYMPITHDFYSDDKFVIVVDSPLMIDWKHVFTRKIPIKLYHEHPTIIHVIDKRTWTIEKYYLDEGVYVFHFANLIENKDTLELYAPLYDSFDFHNIKITGKYRKLILNKLNKIAVMEKTLENEIRNIEFPVRIDNKRYVTYNYEDGKINGLLIIEGLYIKKKFLFQHLSIMGEHTIHYIDSEPHLFFFALNELKNQYFLVIINVNRNHIVEIPLPKDLDVTFSFHSLFVPNEEPTKQNTTDNILKDFIFYDW